MLALASGHATVGTAVLIDVPRANDGPPGRCAGGDGSLNLHGYFPTRGTRLPVTDIRPAIEAAAYMPMPATATAKTNILTAAVSVSAKLSRWSMRERKRHVMEKSRSERLERPD